MTYSLTNGNADLITTLGAVLNTIALPRFPDCTTVEVVSMSVLGENGDLFAAPGGRITP